MDPKAWGSAESISGAERKTKPVVGGASSGRVPYLVGERRKKAGARHFRVAMGLLDANHLFLWLEDCKTIELERGP